ncbi:MAG TPA: energy transducer TonB [Verrucomicrobiae bacterium]|nr:energy transducer TonB [Verrucomicrobiae bacterium]
MTAAPSGSPDPNLFSMVSANAPYRARGEAFMLSVLGQILLLALVTYFTSCVIRNPRGIVARVSDLAQLPLVFSGLNGGGGGNHEKLPASRGDLPKASLEVQLAPPTVRVPKEMPKLAAEETVMAAPSIRFPQSGQIGDPMSRFVGALSDGPGGPTGIGPGCCGGIGTSTGPWVGDGPPGIFPAGKMGVTIPLVIYSPEPSFSDEARKAKMQGTVLLLLVVGEDGRPYGIRVGQSLGMGLDEKATEAVSHWRFKPATLNGRPVATQIAVQVDFHLY